MHLRTVSLSLLLLTSACVVDEDDPELASDEQALYGLSDAIWHKLSIPVCWENPSWASSTWRGWVRSAVEGSWEAESRVDFTGWGTCTSSASGLRILIVESEAKTVDIGRYLDGVEAGIHLNANYTFWLTGCQDERERCTRAIAIHEFGHALGFEHEQNRPDTPDSCDEPSDDEGDISVGPWDGESVMNYCASDRFAGVLTATDIKGVRQFYGYEGFANRRKAATEWPNGKVYFFNGAEYTRADADGKQADSGYPKKIADAWGNWPASWNDGVDAAVFWPSMFGYMFRDDEYLKFDLTFTVLPGYPKKIAGNWTGWPASWDRIDAATVWDNGKAYFFRGSQYIRFDITTDRVDPGYPNQIVDAWPGLYQQNLDSAFRLEDKGYFFRGTSYERFDTDDHEVDEGYPANIVGNWEGVPF